VKLKQLRWNGGNVAGSKPTEAEIRNGQKERQIGELTPSESNGLDFNDRD
jgi:hypothetical protein